MLQQEAPGDFVLASGETHSVREFVELAAAAAGIQFAFEGKDENVRGIDTMSGKTIVSIAKEFYRPAEVDLLLGDFSKAKTLMNWSPLTSFPQLVQMMVEKDIIRAMEGPISE